MNFKHCVGCFIKRIVEDGGSLPNTNEIGYYIDEFISNSIAGNKMMSKHWSEKLLEESLINHKKYVAKTLNDFSVDNIRKIYPEYCL